MKVLEIQHIYVCPYTSPVYPFLATDQNHPGEVKETLPMKHQFPYLPFNLWITCSSQAEEDTWPWDSPSSSPFTTTSSELQVSCHPTHCCLFWTQQHSSLTGSCSPKPAEQDAVTYSAPRHRNNRTTDLTDPGTDTAQLFFFSSHLLLWGTYVMKMKDKKVLVYTQ